MPSKTIAGGENGKQGILSSRRTISGPKSKRIALNSRNRSLGGEKKQLTMSLSTFPPKSEYEQFYESVFLAEETPENEVQAVRRRPGPRSSKRPLQVLLDDEPTPSIASPPAKITAPKKNVEPVNAIASKNETSPIVNGISSKAKKMRQAKFEEFYTKTERHVWKKDAERMLLQLWAQHLKDFRGEAKNVLIYRQMAKEMSEFGPSHTELKTKMDNMSRKYRIEAERVRESGIPSKWEHFHKLQALLIGTNAVDVFEDIMVDNPAQVLFGNDEDFENEEMASIKDDSITEDLKAESENELCTKKTIIKRARSPSPVLPDIQEEEEEDEGDGEAEVDLEEEEEDEDELPEERSPSPVHKYRSKRKINVSQADRLLQIEEEKLLIEREKLQVMKKALVELNSFHKNLINLFKHKN
ncbi:LOW QUALITY PROTEIN: uncharacterized protein LOC108100151 [Drosophila ficusphila]|uniref:LOW QUALITY PROTEIN: uncharacterized protein LOC108100151 n=1 Tax=Drosophila ficusphila TaxID=30025 RepID=UPI001C8AC3E4|nr:LOW QUALITY PROTEIN: uncharacterized protein LOC108100151 [Drosophila ficusphila]